MSSSLITLDAAGRIDVCLEKPSPEERAACADKICYINSGIYILQRRVLERIPAGEKYDFSTHLFPKLIAEGFDLYGYPSTEYFREVGRPEKYAALKKECAGKRDIFG